MTSPIIGPRTMEQLDDLLAGVDVRLTDQILDRIDEIVPPGTDVGTLDMAYRPPALQRPDLRRRSMRPAGRQANPAQSTRPLAHGALSSGLVAVRVRVGGLRPARPEEESIVMPELKVLLGGLGIPESPRWHEGRLWFCNWIDRQIMAVDMDGKAEVVLTRDLASHSMGYSIDWLPDGRLLTTGDKVRRHEPDGSMAVHAAQPANEIVVDACGNAYVNGADFGDFVAAGTPPKPGYIKVVTGLDPQWNGHGR